MRRCLVFFPPTHSVIRSLPTRWYRVTFAVNGEADEWGSGFRALRACLLRKLVIRGLLANWRNPLTRKMLLCHCSPLKMVRNSWFSITSCLFCAATQLASRDLRHNKTGQFSLPACYRYAFPHENESQYIPPHETPALLSIQARESRGIDRFCD